MRVALISEGGYPYQSGGGGNWCHELVTGLPQHQFTVVAVTGAGQPPVPRYRLPGNVAHLIPAPVWTAPNRAPGRLARRRARKLATSAAVRLCRALAEAEPEPAASTRFRDALLGLSHVAGDGAHPLVDTPLADVLADAWRAAGATPRLSLHDADAAAVLLEHALRPLATAVGPVDLCHPTCGGLPLLVALAAKWRSGIPFLLTEQGIYLRERYLDYGRALPEPVREVMLRFFRGLSRLGYREAALVVAASRFNQRWQLQHGAHPARVVVVPGGVDPARFPPQPVGGAASHTVVAVGRIEPLKDLRTLIYAFRRVRRELPQARLRLVGPAADRAYEATCRALIRRLGMVGAVELAGPVPDPATGYAAGEVVVRSSISEGLPYGVIEAMMCGRATVSADVGGVAEVVGDAGVVIPPEDPAACATALVDLLRAPDRRRALGQAAARRAREEFPLARVLRTYHQLYVDVAAPVPVSPPPPTAGDPAALVPPAASRPLVRLERP